MVDQPTVQSLLEQLASRGLSRREVMKITGGTLSAGALSAALAAYGPQRGSAAPQLGGRLTPSLRQEDSTVIVGLVAEPTSLDPQQVTDINSMRVQRSMFDSLLDFELGTFNLIPGLAESWTISDDNLTYTFKLREGVQFHDGTPFNAEAVKFNFERMLDESHPYYETGPFPFASFYFGAIDTVEAVDDLTVEMTLSEPYAPLLNNLATATGFISSPAAIEQHGSEYSQHPVGTGPFKFVSWEHGVRVTMEANADYWDGAPTLSNLVFRPITEEQTRVTELLSGGVNFTVDVPPDNIAQVQQDPNLQYVEQPGPHIWWLSINTQMKPFDDVRVRQALNYAVNKEAIVEGILQNTGTVAHTVVPPAIEWAYNPEAQQYPYDPEKAKQLLEEAGVSNLTTTFWVTESGSGMQSPRTMAQAIQADLQAVGITTELVVMEWGAYLEKYNSGMGEEAGLAEMSWMFGSGDPDTVLPLAIQGDAIPPDGFNTGHYQNERVDELLESARQVTDLEERGAMYKEVQEITSEEAPWLFVDYAKQNAAMTANIKGFELAPTFLLSFKNVSIE
jgi:peptide/nickel transport system substrate-binding protein